MPDIADSPRNREICLCENCPSKPDDGWTGVYCGRGLSPVEVKTTGCRCTDCRLYQENALREGYFCAVAPELWDRVREHSRTGQERQQPENR